MEFPIVSKLGGRERVFNRLVAAGLRIRTVHAMRMWVRRGSIPGDAQNLMMQIAETDGVEYKASDFILPTSQHTPAAADKHDHSGDLAHIAEPAP